MLSRLVDHLEVAELDEAIRVVTRSAIVSAVVVDDSAGSGTHGLLETLRAMEPSLRMILISGGEDEHADLVLPPPVDQLTLATALVAESRIYGHEVASAFGDAVVIALEEGFDTPGEIRARYLKTNRRHLGRVSAVLPFVGRGYHGWVSINSEAKALRAILETVLPDTASSAHQLQDLAGEIANHVVRQLRPRVPGSRVSGVTVRDYLRGSHSDARETRVGHSIVLEVQTAAGPVFAQLHLEGDSDLEVELAPDVRTEKLEFL